MSAYSQEVSEGLYLDRKGPSVQIGHANVVARPQVESDGVSHPQLRKG